MVFVYFLPIKSKSLRGLSEKNKIVF